MSKSMLHKGSLLLILASFAFLNACTGGGTGAGESTEARWPKSDKLSPSAMPDDKPNWEGVYFVNTPMRSRGMVHILMNGPDKVVGCWLHEEKRSSARFTGRVNQNILKIEWTERLLGTVQPPTRSTAYFVMKKNEKTNKVELSGEYGETLQDDSGNAWTAVFQRNQAPKLDACKLEAGDSISIDNKALD